MQRAKTYQVWFGDRQVFTGAKKRRGFNIFIDFHTKLLVKEMNIIKNNVNIMKNFYNI